MMNAEQSAEVLTRLTQGKSLVGLGLGVHDGRADLRGLQVPKAMVTRRLRTKIADVDVFSPLTKVHNARWEGLDLTGSSLQHILFSDCVVENCVFDKCQCQNWGLWGTVLTRCRFRRTDLRQACLGGLSGTRQCAYHKVDFSDADLRGIACSGAEFAECVFRNTKLTRVNFGGSSFTDCLFEGDLDEVCFNRTAFRKEWLPPNEMKRVDLRRARLRYVEFRGLDMADVLFPEDEDHVIVDDYPATLDRLIEIFEADADIRFRALAAGLTVYRKWAGKNQQRGVLNTNDFFEDPDPEAVQRVLNLIGTARVR